MNAHFDYLNMVINKTKKRFPNPEIQWANYYEVQKLQEKRDLLIASGLLYDAFGHTKYFHSHLSQGCQLCGQGEWSCLFITNKCNARCFYCPAPQINDELPETQGIIFETPAQYSNYVNKLGFKGVSFSGGEPLLVKDRVIEYLVDLRKNCAPDLYIWMYTNGILATKSILGDLGKKGLNEIRFDIGATNYSLNKLRLAKGKIPVITVEIPAVPEEAETIKNLLPDLCNVGVTQLNLHQLRLTPFNQAKIVPRGYTIIPAEQPIVLESEIAALEIATYAAEQKLPIGINYCSFFFKNRYQKAGFRRKLAILAGEKAITAPGYSRTVQENSIEYYRHCILQENTGNDANNQIPFDDKICYISKQKTAQFTVTDAEKEQILSGIDANKIPCDQLQFSVWQHECIEKGMREYF